MLSVCQFVYSVTKTKRVCLFSLFTHKKRVHEDLFSSDWNVFTKTTHCTFKVLSGKNVRLSLFSASQKWEIAVFLHLQNNWNKGVWKRHPRLLGNIFSQISDILFNKRHIYRSVKSASYSQCVFFSQILIFFSDFNKTSILNLASIPQKSSHIIRFLDKTSPEWFIKVCVTVKL